MKKRILLIIAAALAALLTACDAREAPESIQVSGAAPSRAVVAYFSVSGNTGRVAEHIAKTAQADLYRIAAKKPYSKADLDYKTPGCRSSEEFKDPASRPIIADDLNTLGGYQVIYLGFPIWYGVAPKIVYTFVEALDLTGKTVIPFCTSGSSGIDKALEELLPLGRKGLWLKGKRFASHAGEAEVKEWVKSLGLETTGMDPGHVRTITSASTVSGNEFTGNVMVKYFPECVGRRYTEIPYASYVTSCRQRIEDAVYVMIDNSQLNGLASAGWSYTYLADPVTDVMENDPRSALREFGRKDERQIKKDFTCALYDTRRFTAGKKRNPLYNSDSLAVIRYRDKIIWFKILGAETDKNLCAACDAMLLDNGRYMVATPRGAYYITETDGKMISEFYHDYARVSRGGKEMQEKDRPLPKIEILTENMVRYSFDDGREEIWRIRLSMSDIRKNLGKQSYELNDNRDLKSMKYLQWWNGKGGEATAPHPGIENIRMWCYTQGER
ncbi:MAG: hypothetical protein IK083_06320 [Abditibacteriota bacterium]|nr:hypothetical protein [Abditibacteriota bacterium]